jgi:error-prone DNA polymerase
MGFYSPMTLIKDAQRHGLRFLPVDATRSRWECTIEPDRGERCVRLGFNYVKGFREQTARAIERERARRPFSSIDDLARRVPLSKDELTALAELGALNGIAEQMHRRESLWHASLAMRRTPALLAGAAAPETPSPLAPMNDGERLAADFRNSGLTIGRHPMTYYRAALRERRVLAANQLAHLADGGAVRVAGAVICRQQPATAKGFVFLSLEDETGIANIILRPDLFRATRPTVIQEPYLLIDGTLQNQFGAVSVKASRVRALDAHAVAMPSHDFH